MTAPNEPEATSPDPKGVEIKLPCCFTLEEIMFAPPKPGQIRSGGTLRLARVGPGGGCVQCLTLYLHSTHPGIFCPPPFACVSEEDTEVSIEVAITPQKETTTVYVHAFTGVEYGQTPQIIRTEVVVPQLVMPEAS